MEMEDVMIDSPEKEKLISRLKKLRFEDLKISKHFFNKHGLPRHGISFEEAKNIFYQFDKLNFIFTRGGVTGQKYSLIYKINHKKSYYLIILLDENPALLFDAYIHHGDINRRLFRKFFG
jgi:hypothetical protein